MSFVIIRLILILIQIHNNQVQTAESVCAYLDDTGQVQCIYMNVML
jgi:hypothetical protein